MKFYLTFVGLGLLMSAMCLLLKAHAPPPAMAVMGLFGT